MYMRIYLCTHMPPHPRLLLCTYSWRDSFACSARRPADSAPRELATLLAMPFLISPFPAVVGFYSDFPPFNFPHKWL